MNKGLRRSVGLLVLIASGICLNLLLGRIASGFNTPLYLDTVGTMVTAVIGGYVPGIVVALSTNLINAIQDDYNAYFGIINVLIALITTYFYNKGLFKKIRYILCYILLISFLGGIYGYFISWTLEGSYSGGMVHDISAYLSGLLHIDIFFSDAIASFIIDILDKVPSFILSSIILKFVPQSIFSEMNSIGWLQTPVGNKVFKHINKNKSRVISIKYKVIIVISAACFMIVFILSAISLRLFSDYSKNQHINLAKQAANAAVLCIDPEMVDDYIAHGEAVPGYRDTENNLEIIKNVSKDVEYLYVYKIKEDGCHVVFDLDSADVEGSDPGTLIEFDEGFAPYLPSLLAGDRIEPLITDDKYGWLLTVYEPVYDKTGKCSCYVGVDISMQDLNVYKKNFLMKFSSLGFGFFILILALSLWLAKYHIVYPINTMAEEAGKFLYNNEEELTNNVEQFKELKIRTGDEIENLYLTFVKTTEDSVAYYEEAQNKTAALSELQSGLLVVLADIVENRDESTGNHVKKTAAYTRIILEGLRKKGYYADQITDEYIKDVVQSAPLHDIGKIAIPDAILNKPGKLNDNEFEIMKSHTTAGEEIITKAMATLNNAEYLGEAKNLATYHHEKWNGKGYPRGLSGEDIPLSARVMAVADVFDALVSKRIYKPAFTFEKAMSIINEDAGSHFDPKVAEVFIEASEEVRKTQEKFDKEYEEMQKTINA